MKYCTKCGTELKDEDAKCPQCGYTQPSMVIEDFKKAAGEFGKATGKFGKVAGDVLHQSVNEINDLVGDKLKEKCENEDVKEKIGNIQSYVKSKDKKTVIAIIAVVLVSLISFLGWYNSEDKKICRAAVNGVELYTKLTEKNPSEKDVQKYIQNISKMMPAQTRAQQKDAVIAEFKRAKQNGGYSNEKIRNMEVCGTEGEIITSIAQGVSAQRVMVKVKYEDDDGKKSVSYLEVSVVKNNDGEWEFGSIDGSIPEDVLEEYIKRRM